MIEDESTGYILAPHCHATVLHGSQTPRRPRALARGLRGAIGVRADRAPPPEWGIAESRTPLDFNIARFISCLLT